MYLVRHSAVIALVVATLASSANAADRPAKLDDAVERSLGYLARQQRPDGFFDHERKPEGKDADASGHRRAITGLCALAFLSAGHVPDAGRHGKVVRSAVDALTNVVPEDGYVGKLDEKPMYTQAIVTLALSQAIGAEPLADRRAKQHAALRRLVKVIVDAQAVRKDSPHAGGWRYTREAPDSDLSLSGWNALALRGAADAGIDVPPDAIKKAVYYVAGCYVAEKKGFAYQPGGDLRAGTTATGVLCLYLLDRGVRVEARDRRRHARREGHRRLPVLRHVLRRSGVRPGRRRGVEGGGAAGARPADQGAGAGRRVAEGVAVREPGARAGLPRGDGDAHADRAVPGAARVPAVTRTESRASRVRSVFAEPRLGGFQKCAR
jgi:hypothetical protein